MSRYLITTADETTWKFDRPVIFLGEWCRLYDRKHIWENMDAIVAEPYGLGKDAKDKDHYESREIEEELFPLLTEILNEYHGTSHNKRFWRIVLGHWFRRYINVMINRIRTLEQCIQTHEISGISTYAKSNYSLATLDSNSAIWAFNDDHWNNVLHNRILGILNNTTIYQIDIISDSMSTGFSFTPFPPPHRLTRRIPKPAYHQISSFTICLKSVINSLIIIIY